MPSKSKKARARKAKEKVKDPHRRPTPNDKRRHKLRQMRFGKPPRSVTVIRENQRRIAELESQLRGRPSVVVAGSVGGQVQPQPWMDIMRNIIGTTAKTPLAPVLQPAVAAPVQPPVQTSVLPKDSYTPTPKSEQQPQQVQVTPEEHEQMAGPLGVDVSGWDPSNPDSHHIPLEEVDDFEPVSQPQQLQPAQSQPPSQPVQAPQSQYLQPPGPQSRLRLRETILQPPLSQPPSQPSVIRNPRSEIKFKPR